MPRRVARRPRVSEAALERAHVKEAEADGWLVWKQSGLGRAGRPDRHYIGPNGEHGMIEWKRPGEVPTALQADTLDLLEHMGHKVAACDTLESAQVFLHSVTVNDRVMPWRERWEAEHKHDHVSDNPPKPLPPYRARGWFRA